ncbi:hypothetical protein [Rarobacter faecitabidus]|nr:hypothetical protein [Rarobacter faecitabidus]
MKAIEHVTLTTKIRLGTLEAKARPKRRARMLAVESPESPDRKRVLRALELAGVNPNAVAIDPPPFASRNFLEFSEIQFDGPRKIIHHRKGKFVTKRRVIRNPDPRLWRKP